MPRQAPLQDLALPLPQAGETWHRWLHRQLRDRILDGRLRPGARLPSSRSLARQYGMARGTVVAVYEQLVLEGYIESKVGSGSIVSPRLPQGAESPRTPPTKNGSTTVPRYVPTPLAHLFPTAPAINVQRAFVANLPAVDAFPMERWVRITSRVLRRLSTQHLARIDSRGWRPLREALADYLARARGVQAEPDQIFITAGTQQALDLVARVLARRGARAVVEDPAYVGVLPAFRGAGMDVCSVPVDDDGLNVAGGREICPQPALCYVTPAHQSPTGVMMPLERRLRLLEWSREAGFWIFEDDYDGEYRFDGRPIASLQSLDASGGVLYALSLTKLLFPSIRLGCLVVPPPLVEPLLAQRVVVDRFAPVIEQAVLAEFIAEGDFERHLRKMRELYASRRSCLQELAQTYWGDRLRLETARAGLQVAAWLPEGVRDSEVAEALQAHTVEAMPISEAFRAPERARQGLLLGFAAAHPPELKRGAIALARVLERL